MEDSDARAMWSHSHSSKPAMEDRNNCVVITTGHTPEHRGSRIARFYCTGLLQY